MFVSIGPNLCNSVFGILDFRPQEQQQQQCGIASVRIMGGAAVTATNRQRPATVNVGNTNVGMAANNPNIVGNMLPQHVPISYYTHSAPQTSYFNDVLHPMQVKRSHKIHIRNNGKCQPNCCQLEQLSLWIYLRWKYLLLSEDYSVSTDGDVIRKDFNLTQWFLFCIDLGSTNATGAATISTGNKCTAPSTTSSASNPWNARADQRFMPAIVCSWLW